MSSEFKHVISSDLSLAPSDSPVISSVGIISPVCQSVIWAWCCPKIICLWGIGVFSWFRNLSANEYHYNSRTHAYNFWNDCRSSFSGSNSIPLWTYFRFVSNSNSCGFLSTFRISAGRYPDQTRLLLKKQFMKLLSYPRHIANVID